MTRHCKILLCCDDIKLVDFISLVVFKSLMSTVEVVVNVQMATEEIKAGNIPDLLMIKLPQEDGIQDYFDYAMGKHTIPVLFLADDNHIHLAGEYLPYHPLCGKVSYNLSETIIGTSIKRMLRIARRGGNPAIDNLKKVRSPRQRKYMELPIVLFFRSQKIPYDLYLKMSETKYVKVFSKGDELVREDFEKYCDRNVGTIYLLSEDYLEVTIKFSQKMSKALENKNLRVETYSSISLYSLKEINKIINRLGMREEVLELVNQAFESNKKLLEKNKSLRDLLDKTMKRKDFISEHSQMLSFITVAIAKYMHWPSATTANKLMLASLFHDMALDDCELAKEENIEELNDSKRDKCLNHPKKSSELLVNIDGIPPDVDKIILQHHEKPDGNGFPRGLKWNRIFPLAAVFIVAEDFTHSVFECGLEALNVDHILDEMEARYEGQGNFSLAVCALKMAMGYSRPEVLQAV